MEPPATPECTLDRVLDDLRSIIDSCRTAGDRTGLFASMYRSVTIQVHEAVRSGGFFDNDERLERFAVAFADRYIDAHRAFASQRAISDSWQVAFDYAAQPRGRMILQHLLLGMNAHINLDLGIAAAQASRGPLVELYADFVRINEILFAMLDLIEERLGEVSPRIALLDRIGGPADEFFMRLGIRTARDLAWRFALRLDAAEGARLGNYIRERDEDTARLAKFIGSGWSPFHLMGRYIAAPEAGRVGAAMDVFAAERADLDSVERKVATELSRPLAPERRLAPKPWRDRRRGF